MIDRLRTVLQDRPDDLRGHELLVQAEARSQDFARAHQTQAKIIALKGMQVTGQDWLQYTELLLAAADGLFSAQSRDALQTTLRMGPTNPLAQFRLGELHLQTGRFDRAFQVWRRLLETQPPNLPFIPYIRDRIEDLALEAGIARYTPPPAPRGPSPEDINAAEGMTAADRTAMIENMVEGLAARLAAEGGRAEDWAQLINALGVLGRRAQAQNIWVEAQEVFATDPDGLALIRTAAMRAGLIE